MDIRTTCDSPQCEGKTPAKSVDISTGVFHCFRCGDKGKTDAFVVFDYAQGTIVPPKKVKTDSPKPQPLTSYAKSYLRVRKVSDEIIDLMQIKSTKHGLFFPFPGFDYWQERRWSNFSPKWNNPTDKPGKKAGTYYAVNSYDLEDLVVVVEGIFDALVVGNLYNSLAILGKTISEQQAIKIASRYKIAVLLLDSDTTVEERTKALRTLSNYLPTKVIVCPHGDPATVENLETLLLHGIPC